MRCRSNALVPFAVAAFFSGGDLTSQTAAPAPRRVGPVLVVELADLAHPLRGLEETTIGSKLAERFGTALADWVRVAGEGRDDGDEDAGERRRALADVVRWLGRTRFEVRMSTAGIEFDARMRLHEGAPPTVTQGLRRAMRSEAQDEVDIRRDGDDVLLHGAIDPFGSAPEGEGAATQFAPGEPAAPIVVRLDLVEALLAAALLPDALHSARSGSRTGPDQIVQKIESALRPVLDGWLRYEIRVHAVGNRLAADVRGDGKPFVTEAGLRTLRLLPVDLEGAFGCASFDLARIVRAVRAVHEVLPLPGVGPERDPIAHASEAAGIDLGALLPAFEGSYSGFVGYDPAGFDLGALYVFALRDPAPVGKAIDALLERFELKRSVAKREHAGYTRHQLLLGPIVVQWAITERDLLLGIGDRRGRDAIEAAMERARALQDGKPLPLPSAAGTDQPTGAATGAPDAPAAGATLIAAADLERTLSIGGAPDAADQQFLTFAKSLGITTLRAYVLPTAEGQILRLHFH